MSPNPKKHSSTLIRPPGADPSKSPIENVLELIPLSDIGTGIYTNARELWHPPGARGIYGGAVIAQCLAAAQNTIPPPSAANGNAVFLVHSMHCYFVLAGNSSVPILYHVERVREGTSFMTRTVQARQRGKCIFTTTCSFMREGSGGEKTVEHESEIPEGVVEELTTILDQEKIAEITNKSLGANQAGPFMAHRLDILNQTSSKPHTKRSRQWLRARGNISPQGGQHAHLNALAYMTDSYFIGFISLVHNLSRFPRALDDVPSKMPTTSAGHHLPPSGTPSELKLSSQSASTVQYLKMMTELEKAKIVSSSNPSKGTVGMMVSLDHTIYFHRPREFQVDEWMYTEIESPWAGEGRGLVMQRIWNRGGRLIATCVQEGLVRLVQDGAVKSEKSRL